MNRASSRCSRQLSALAAIFLVLGCWVASVSGEDWDGLYQRALKLLAQGKIVPGLKLYFKTYLFSDLPFPRDMRRADLGPLFKTIPKPKPLPADKGVYLVRALLDRLVDNNARAEKTLDGLFGKFPEIPIILFLTGEVSLANKKTEKTAKFFDLLMKHPKGKTWESAVSRAWIRHGVSADRDHPPSIDDLLAKAQSFYEQGDSEAAVTLLRQAIFRNPKEVKFVRLLATIFLDQGEFSEVKKLSESPDAPKPVLIPHQMARLHYGLGEFDKALAFSDEILKEDAKDPFGHWCRSECLFQTGKWGEAEKAYGALFEAEKDNQGYCLRQAACLEELCRFWDAAKVLESFLKNHSDNDFIRSEYGAMLLRHGNWKAGIREWKKLEGSKEFSELAHAVLQELETGVALDSRNAKGPNKGDGKGIVVRDEFSQAQRVGMMLKNREFQPKGK